MWGALRDYGIELGEDADLAPCPDCGKASKSVWGYVSKNNQAHSVYYASWNENHPDRGVQFFLSIGKWGQGSGAAMRKKIALDCRMGPERPAFMVLDASKMPFADEELGKGLTREQVLDDPMKDEVFLIIDQVSFDDKRIKTFLSSAK